MAFEADGYAIAALFKPDEIAALTTEAAGYLDRLTRTLLLPYAETAPEAPLHERIAAHDPSYAHLIGAAIATDAHRGKAAQAIAHDQRLTEAAEVLLGAKVGERTVRFRGNSSAMGEHRSDWHSDVAIADGTLCSTVKLTAWIPLTDTGPETGGLELAIAKRDGPLPHEQDTSHFIIPECLVAQDAKARPDVPVGSCLLMDRYTPHRALPNRTGKTRWSLVVWMKSAG